MRRFPKDLATSEDDLLIVLLAQRVVPDIPLQAHAAAFDVRPGTLEKGIRRFMSKDKNVEKYGTFVAMLGL